MKKVLLALCLMAATAFAQAADEPKKKSIDDNAAGMENSDSAGHEQEKKEAEEDPDPSQHFNFVGAAAFSHTAGELHYAAVSGGVLLTGDVNGDAIADFSLQIAGVTLLQTSDFILV